MVLDAVLFPVGKVVPVRVASSFVVCSVFVLVSTVDEFEFVVL